MSRGTGGTVGLRHGTFNSSNRQVSAGAVWGAGGSAAATGITAVPDGRVLDAPALRDDYYCSLLAYSPSVKCLAVGLSDHVYLWSEHRGVDTPDSLNAPYTAHVTSLAFSSTQGGRAILATGRADGRITLWSPFDEGPRFDSEQPHPVSCVSFRPAVVKRPSLRDPYVTVETEELLVGDEAGHIYVYSIEWPSSNDRDLFAWHGAMTLLARMTAHSQQICGIAWSRDGSLFATGGNDNICLLFEMKAVTSPVPAPGRVLAIDASHAKHEFVLSAAIKALAFSPHHPSLLALGGGSNDRHIHFYHAGSAAPLASINCFAQVTSLVWSNTRNEVCATFGFAQPEHPYRIAVFAWPSCQQVVAIPWAEGGRALWSIPYPGGPETGRSRGEGGTWCRRTEQEGCIVVATSESSIKFHEVWSEDRRIKGGLGSLGGSNILESLEGLDRDEGLAIR
ncbi:hypothetical protein W97_06984 [Coniosporium apollinis CBS 100218]|uniref:Uncharacterized protein n=1 Tax=Coniosporium apollinis (strain CBS 100218) TaxID=1168221 RepID=R7Z0J9_CONA1|nr:uncharacterized protein W97_06984 [Coniosporium apollinis CBS 100218]EON67730.1 hypothetical protein W97_06984 [Coniosporium apollinis CBS 100218]